MTTQTGPVTSRCLQLFRSSVSSKDKALISSLMGILHSCLPWHSLELAPRLLGGEQGRSGEALRQRLPHFIKQDAALLRRWGREEGRRTVRVFNKQLWSSSFVVAAPQISAGFPLFFRCPNAGSNMGPLWGLPSAWDLSVACPTQA